jgi:hypothetical protein
MNPGPLGAAAKVAAPSTNLCVFSVGGKKGDLVSVETWDGSGRHGSLGVPVAARRGRAVGADAGDREAMETI